MIGLQLWNRWVWAGVIAVVISQLAARPEPPVGAVLTYEVDPEALDDNSSVDMHDLLIVVNERLAGEGKARALDDKKFAVDVYGDVGDRRLDAIRMRIGVQGTLQFRIMASPKIPSHQAIIKLAESLPSANKVRFENKDVACWVDCDPQEYAAPNGPHERGMVGRSKSGAIQALALLNDGMDVSGMHLKSASAIVDETGRPAIDFALNPDGAALFGQLTAQHIPTPAGERYQLGIVLDNRLLAAPTIHSKITERGRISGNLTKEEVEAIVAIFQVGHLPRAVRELDARIVPSQ